MNVKAISRMVHDIEAADHRMRKATSSKNIPNEIIRNILDIYTASDNIQNEVLKRLAPLTEKDLIFHNGKVCEKRSDFPIPRYQFFIDEEDVSGFLMSSFIMDDPLGSFCIKRKDVEPISYDGLMNPPDVRLSSLESEDGPLISRRIFDYIAVTFDCGMDLYLGRLHPSDGKPALESLIHRDWDDIGNDDKAIHNYWTYFIKQASYISRKCGVPLLIQNYGFDD